MDDNSSACQWTYKRDNPVFGELYDYAKRVHDKFWKKDPLNAMAKIVDKAADLYKGDWNKMLPALSQLFIGVPNNGPGTLIAANDIETNPWYLLEFGDRTFNKGFQDGGNQVYHVWGYITQTAVPNSNPFLFSYTTNEAVAGNYKHEYFDKHGSWEDYALGITGIRIGSRISLGLISPSELGNVLRTELGVDASPDYLKYQSPFEYFTLP